MAGPLYADELLALIRRALMSPGDAACKVYVDTGGVDDGFVHCTARVDGDGDIVIAPVR